MDSVRVLVVEEDSERLPRPRPPAPAVVAAVLAATAILAVAIAGGGGPPPQGPPAPAWAPAPDLVRALRASSACSGPCGRVRLRVRLKAPAAHVWATLAGRTSALEDAIGGGRSYAAIVPDAEARGEMVVRVALLIERADGTRQHTSTSTWLFPAG